MNAASASLPAPDSPVISTFASVVATRSARPTASRIASDSATISIIMLLSKNPYARDRRAKHRDVSLHARAAPGHRSDAPSHQRHAPRNRRNRPEPTPRFDNHPQPLP